MSSAFDHHLEKYAEVVVKVGLNLQHGQRLQITASVESAQLVRLIVMKAYDTGARLVDVLWYDDEIRLIRFQHAPRDSFEEFPTWRAETMTEMASAGDAILFISSPNPDLLIDQDPKMVATVQRVYSKHMEPYFKLLSKNAMNWTIISAPVKGWADKVFPDLMPGNREEKLWEHIFEICRVNQVDPVSSWEAHIQKLINRCEYLNHKKYKALKTSAPGTDLRVGLPIGHKWCGGREITKKGIQFTPNIPTEEVCTLPHKDLTEGFVTATKPLNYDGLLIEDFCLTFSKGKVVKATAKKGEDILHELLDRDKGASKLGEVALVPHSSPISQSGIQFYDALLDENAANHLALGDGLRFMIENGESMTKDEFQHAGGNDSLIHMDFMVGSEKMDVDGITNDDKAEPIMRNGEWAFEV